MPTRVTAHANLLLGAKQSDPMSVHPFSEPLVLRSSESFWTELIFCTYMSKNAEMSSEVQIETLTL